MKLETFKDAVNDLFVYFNYRKNPEVKAIETWFEVVKHIPDVAVKWICNRMKNEFDNLPRNLGKAFLGGWYIYQSSNPEKMLKNAYVVVKCDACNSRGLLWYLKERDGYVSTHYCRCAKCDNYKQFFNNPEIAGVPTTREAIEKAGYIVDLPSKVLPERPTFKGSVRDLAVGIGADIPF